MNKFNHSTKLQKQIVIYLFCGMVTACTLRTTTTSAAPETNPSGTVIPADQSEVEELPLPHVPATLQRPTERANYIVEHFWDAMNFNDTLRSHSADFIEQNFVNYLSLFPLAEASALQSSVHRLLKNAEADTEAYRLLIDTAEKYLYEPDSPMLSEEFYRIFLENIIHSPVIGDTRIRYSYLLEATNKNRPGSKAADFTYTTPDGKRTSLYNTPADNSLLLFFYDPECDHCKDVMDELQNHPLLNQSISTGKIRVLAVYADGNRSLWKQTVSELPENWTPVYETGAIRSKGLYVLRALPSLYLLDNSKQVILKEVSAERLIEWLQQS